MKILVSACLLGFNTRYDGESKKDRELLKELLDKGVEFFPLCLEQLGGLPTPREPSEIEDGYTARDVIDGRGKVVTESGLDVTENFLRGANLVLDFCKEVGITHAILKDKSPSCGYREVYDGTFKKELKKGRGILAELLEEGGVKILENLEIFNQTSL
jgi:uncharacterized protein YbbK (DUF523 family)